MKNIEKPQLTLREMLHFLNCQEEDRDIYVDAMEGADGIAVCGGDIALTHDGFEKFGKVLDMKMDGNTIIGNNADYNAMYDYEELEKGDGGRLYLALELIRALAGYCNSSDYDKWFEGEDAKMI